MRKYYYRRLADPHTLFDRSYLPGERTLLERTKCIGLSMPNAAICIISGRLVVTNFRVIFDPTSGDDFLKERMGWEEGARVMALSNIATAERSGKHLTLHAKDRLRRWSYDPYLEFGRMGITEGGGGPWRISHANEDFKLSPTYPSLLVVPSEMTDQELHECAKYRVKCRLPALCWRSGSAVICRSSQPRVGLLGFARSSADEKFINALGAINPSVPVRIIDVRPKLTAVMHKATGGGYEDYPNTVVSFLDVDNIHVMHESLDKLKKAIVEGTIKDEAQLDWFDRTGRMLSAIYDVVRHMAVYPGPALIHCSDGWDRTSIVCSMMELMMDSFYRTISGFCVLVEKEWLSFGHQFHKRCGHDQLGGDTRPQSPIFVQFIDCVWTTMQLFPNDFEYNEEFLLFVLDNLYTCKHGTFLYDSDYERRENKVEDTTTSLWDEVMDNIALFRNRDYLYRRRTTRPGANNPNAGDDDSPLRSDDSPNHYARRRRSGTVAIGRTPAAMRPRAYEEMLPEQPIDNNVLLGRRRPKGRKTLATMESKEIEELSAAGGGGGAAQSFPAVPQLRVPSQAQQARVTGASPALATVLSPRTMDELPQKILVPSPNALSFLSPSQRVWSNYYLRWLPEKEAARLERMIVKHLLLAAKRKQKRKSNRTVNVPSSFGTKQDVNQLGSEAPYPTCSLATANKHLSTGDVVLWLTPEDTLNREMDIFLEKQFTQAGMVINKTEALFFDYKGWNEVLETAKNAAPDDILFVWYQTDAGDMEVASLR
ncbi:myotubularin, putative [Acanthamoeba castellanii str. Neff]|uniref:Myotubularin, putative n=1 Tax=Acanthamoeba castellanii (strain ATCC 30010 / Neff) TaxID=1257118 RepID=L8GWZ6_ACACF|nr:myotubularin, putative [Acanthamoeba castellanii str. Neff]ELR17482.1 myotubularin, putative [Acanthamoeba castellanii str. Neff]